MTLERLRTEADLYDETFDDVDGEDESFASKEFEACTFRNCKFSEASFAQCVFLDCTFHNCDLSSSRVVNASLRDVHFIGCKLVGVDWTSTNTRMGFDVHFDDCVLDFGNFSRMHLAHLKVTGGRMHDVNLDGVVFKTASLDDVDAQGASLRQADLRRADLSGVHHLAVDVRTCQLGHTRLSADSAFASLALLGIDVV